MEELIVIGFAPVPGAWYMSILYGPPQNSDELPLQGILHPEKPSGAGPPPPENELPQSLESVRHTRGWLMGKGERTALFSIFHTSVFLVVLPTYSYTKSHCQ